MTFKHNKFSNSINEYVPVNSDVPINVKTSLEGSNDLMQNILKLCSGLRKSGLDKFAEELEEKFLAFKRAESLYETSKETGEDVVNDAHPEGSPELDVEGDGVVETTIEQRKKILEVLNAKPKGKLASKDIVSKVNYIFKKRGAPIMVAEKNFEEAKKQYQEYINTLIKDCNSSFPIFDYCIGTFPESINPFGNLNVWKKTKSECQRLIDMLNTMRNIVQPSQNKIISLSNNAYNIASGILNMLDYTSSYFRSDELDSRRSSLEQLFKKIMNQLNIDSSSGSRLVMLSEQFSKSYENLFITQTQVKEEKEIANTNIGEKEPQNTLIEKDASYISLNTSIVNCKKLSMVLLDKIKSYEKLSDDDKSIGMQYVNKKIEALKQIEEKIKETFKEVYSRQEYSGNQETINNVIGGYYNTYNNQISTINTNLTKFAEKWQIDIVKKQLQISTINYIVRSRFADCQDTESKATVDGQSYTYKEIYDNFKKFIDDRKQKFDELSKEYKDKDSSFAKEYADKVREQVMQPLKSNVPVLFDNVNI